MTQTIQLSDEQKRFVDEALTGKNILVDACIGSGKTTAIQYLCNVFPSNKKILYLTYNRLLKIDAKSKITQRNVLVQNYHGYAYMVLKRLKIDHVGTSDMIQRFIHENPDCSGIDVLIMDEYQDIDTEISEMLTIIKNSNPGIQLIAVGDMQQKIYNRTTLKVYSFINEFLGDKLALEFTKCFRLNDTYAKKLGRIWGKSIEGVNNTCTVEIMDKREVIGFLEEQNPREVLCLGARYGDLSDTLNRLEARCPEKYNKNNVYASIMDDEGWNKMDNNIGIFTTFDSAKGLERKVCVVFDFTVDYWMTRLKKSDSDYEILKNIFLVAASRGKEKIVFVQGETELLSEEILSTPADENGFANDFDMSSMFDFKYKEDVENCYNCLEIKQLRGPAEPIDIPEYDGLIALSPCIGIYQEALYFKGYDLETEYEFLCRKNKDIDKVYDRDFYSRGDQGKVLVMTTIATHLHRYMNQVETPFVDENAKELIQNRLSEVFTPNEEVQVPCRINFGDGIVADGIADVFKDGKVYELKFVGELTHEHFLQCASYILAMQIEEGVLWNVRTGEMYSVKIKDRAKFMDNVINTITKGTYTYVNDDVAQEYLEVF